MDICLCTVSVVDLCTGTYQMFCLHMFLHTARVHFRVVQLSKISNKHWRTGCVTDLISEIIRFSLA